MEFLTADMVLLFAPDADRAQVEQLVAEVTALATVRVPGLAELVDAAKITAVGAVLRAAVIRHLETGAAGVKSRTEMTGPFMQVEMYESQRKGGLLWPSEIDMLADIVGGAGKSQAFTIETAPVDGYAAHSPWCDIYFSRWPCSCGSIINAGTGPLYEGGILTPWYS